MGRGDSGSNTCGVNEAIVFVVALVAGTGCSLSSKVLLDMHSVGMSGEPEPFEDPLFQTWVMFLGMVMALPCHFMYESWNKKKSGMKIVSPDLDEEDESIPMSTYLLLIIPATFDLAATALCMFGLTFISASIYQLLRGACIVFVALMKNYLLKDPLAGYMWLGVWMIAAAICMVGLTSILGAPDEGEDGKNPAIGVVLILFGALVQSLQYAFEEKVMSTDVGAPPLLVIGMEGFWGFLICTLVLYPVFYALPGADHGSIENPFNTWEMIQNSKDIQYMLVFYYISIFLYNAFAVLVTYLLNSVWHAILDNFRPISVWGTDLFLFYGVCAGQFGEAWTNWSYLELFGLVVLLIGTAVYNASIKIPGFTYPDEKSLIQSNSLMSSPAMARSPLISSNAARARDLPDDLRQQMLTHYLSPKATRVTTYDTDI